MSATQTSDPWPPPPIASLVGVSKVFDGDTGLHDVDVTVPRGAIVGLVGPSGCGKTTLMRLLAGLHAPTSGSVEVLGTDPRAFTRKHRQEVGYMPQLPVLFPNLSLRSNVSFVASLFGVRGRSRRERIDGLLHFVGLDDAATTRFKHASGGMQRRVALAATLVHDPALLLLDEPTAGVDPLLRSRFWRHFRELRSQGRTLVVSTQYVGEAAECDLVAVLVDGRLARFDTPESLVASTLGSAAAASDGGADYDEVFARLVRQAREPVVAS